MSSVFTDWTVAKMPVLNIKTEEIEPLDSREAGLILKRKRNDKHFTAEQLIAMVGIPNVSYLSALETGKYSLGSSKYFPRIARTLGFTHDEIKHINPNLFVQISPKTIGSDVLEPSHLPLFYGIGTVGKAPAGQLTAFLKKDLIVLIANKKPLSAFEFGVYRTLDGAGVITMDKPDHTILTRTFNGTGEPRVHHIKELEFIGTTINLSVVTSQFKNAVWYNQN
jgi:transcriptional regulator with XRE-family HTH domain